LSFETPGPTRSQSRPIWRTRLSKISAQTRQFFPGGFSVGMETSSATSAPISSSHWRNHDRIAALCLVRSSEHRTMNPNARDSFTDWQVPYWAHVRLPLIVGRLEAGATCAQPGMAVPQEGGVKQPRHEEAPQRRIRTRGGAWSRMGTSCGRGGVGWFRGRGDRLRRGEREIRGRR
jgi:hypothetical protein